MLNQFANTPRWRERLAEARRAARHLVLFLTSDPDPLLEAMRALLDAVAPDTGADAEEAADAYRRLFRLLADEGEFHEGERVGDAWQSHLLSALLADDNAFSRKAARSGEGTLGPALRAAAAHDLRQLQVLFRLSSQLFREAVAQRANGITEEREDLVPWEGICPLPQTASRRSPEELALMRAFAGAGDWGALVNDLARHFARAGSGLFHRYRAFRWVSDAAGGHLEGVAHPDPVTLDDMIGYERERRLLLRNTEHFLAGSRANNVLLYGDRGTGKSSSIKALLNAYADRGLRLVEVQKQHLAAFPRILELLRDRRERFILFVDDLSFEEHETYYKDLKAVLEGGLEARPANVLLYATSNRRHLITERFSDRDGGNGEIHTADGVQEKLSLSDRFGVTITFLAPGQEGYLEIVEGLARRFDLRLPPEVLRREALQWAARHNGWSGRTARQFLEFALGEQMAEQSVKS